MRCYHDWHQGENFKNFHFWFRGNCLSRVFLVPLHVISAVFFVIKLVVFVFAYIMHSINLVLRGQEILFRNFLVRSRINFFELEFLLIGLIFLNGKDKQIIF